MTEPIGHRIRTNGLHLRVWEWHAAGAHTLVLIHGFLDMARSWQQVAAALPAEIRVLAVDMRGHGDSGWAPPGCYYYFADYIPDLHGAVAQLCPDRFWLAGHSMGANIVTLYAGAFPERVAKLALLEGLGVPDESGENSASRMREWVEAVAEVRPSKPYRSVEEVASRLQSAHPRITPEWARFLAEHGTRVRDDGQRVWKFDPLHKTRGPHPYREQHRRDFCRRITCPVMFVEAPEANPVLRDWLENLDERMGDFAHLRHEIMRDTGHMLHYDQPAALARLLVDFFAAP